MNQKELIIKNNSFDVTIIDRNNDTVNIVNINDFLRINYVEDYMEFIRFKHAYFHITENRQEKPKVACDLLLNNSISFDRRIPLHQINNIYGLSKDISEKDLNKAIDDYNSGKREYTYYCNDEIDLIVAILYHFLTNDFHLRQCRECSSVFMKSSKQGFYCSKCSEIKKDESNIDKKLKQRIQSKEIYEREFNALRGQLKNHQEKILNYKEKLKSVNDRIGVKRKEYKKNIITKEQLNAFALDLHEEIRKLVEEVCKK